MPRPHCSVKKSLDLFHWSSGRSGQAMLWRLDQSAQVRSEKLSDNKESLKLSRLAREEWRRGLHSVRIVLQATSASRLPWFQPCQLTCQCRQYAKQRSSEVTYFQHIYPLNPIANSSWSCSIARGDTRFTQGYVVAMEGYTENHENSCVLTPHYLSQKKAVLIARISLCTSSVRAVYTTSM